MSGAIMALAVVWYEPIRIARVGVGEHVPISAVRESREEPGSAMLLEIRQLATGAADFTLLSDAEVESAADDLFAGLYWHAGEPQHVSIPFDSGIFPIQDSTWGLRFCSLIVPNLLGRAYEVTNDAKYLRAAVQYIIDWADFEQTLWLPIDAVFNDHAVASRAIVVSDIWRIYRNSSVYDDQSAGQLLSYTAKLGAMLRDPALYEFRSNHGLMQNLALLHLAIAFPKTDDAAINAETGALRLRQQLEYYLNAEGVIQEHSPGYHHQFVETIAASWRYLALLNISVPPDLAQRHQRALEYLDALLRPDRTLPPIGDTPTTPRRPVSVVELDNALQASKPMSHREGGLPGPGRLFLAPAAGYAILWDGLEQWPKTHLLSQTVLVWANFISQAHKHDDELSLSIWWGGSQWVRGAGYWPYLPSRSAATAWRSSNAPHWRNDVAARERDARLEGFTVTEDSAFFDVVRKNKDGRRIRRQVATLSGDLWIVIDQFVGSPSDEAELIWRFAPEVQLDRLEDRIFAIRNPASGKAISLSVLGKDSVRVEADASGSAGWNSGAVDSGEIVRSAAVRLVSGEEAPVFASIFRAASEGNHADISEVPTLSWRNERSWTVTQGASVQVSRNGDRIELVDSNSGLEQENFISNRHKLNADENRTEATDAFLAMQDRYGVPFRLAPKRRNRLSAVIGLGAAAQFLVLIPLARRRQFSASALAWSGFAVWLMISGMLTQFI